MPDIETEAWSRSYQQVEAEIKGRAAGLRGDPMVAPEYDRESMRARWRVGWKKGAAIVAVDANMQARKI